MGLNIPEAYGGFGASAKVFNRVFGEIGATDPALAVLLRRAPVDRLQGHHAVRHARTRSSAGCRAARAARSVAGVLPHRAGLGLRRAGDDERRPSRARTASHYLLTGTKIWISNAGYAGLFTVFAKVPVSQLDGKMKQRVTAFIVDAHAARHLARAARAEDGHQGERHAHGHLRERARAGRGSPGRRGPGLSRSRSRSSTPGRLGLAAGSARGTRRIMHEALVYAKQREQFGRPIGSFEMIQQKIADQRGRDVRGRFGVDADGGHGGQRRHRLLARDGGVQGVRERAGVPRVERRAPDRRRHRLLEGLSVRAVGARLAHQPDLRGDERDPARAHRADGACSSRASGSRRSARRSRTRSTRSAPSGPTSRDARSGRSTKPSFTHGAPRADAMKRRPSRAIVHDLALGGRGHRCSSTARTIIERQFLQERLANAAIDIFLSVAVLSRTTWEIERAGSDAGGRRSSIARGCSSRWRAPRAPQHPRAPRQPGRPHERHCGKCAGHVGPRARGSDGQLSAVP